MNSMKNVVVASLLATPLLLTNVNAGNYNLEATEGKGIGTIKLEKAKNFGWWTGNGSGASWTVNISESGKAQLSAMLSKPGEKPCGDLKALLNGKEISVIPVNGTGGWNNYKSFSFGEVDLPKGRNTISVVVENTKGGYFANMKGLKLKSKELKLTIVKPD